MTEDITAARGPNRKNAIKIGISAKSIWRYGIKGNGIAAFARVRSAASVANTPAPASVTVARWEGDDSVIFCPREQDRPTYNRVSTHFWVRKRLSVSTACRFPHRSFEELTQPYGQLDRILWGPTQSKTELALAMS